MKTANSKSKSALTERAQAQLNMLTLQFLLGMAVNLIGLPSEASGNSKVATSSFLGLHVLISIGLIVGAFLTVRRAKLDGGTHNRLAWIGAGVVLGTITAGVLTMTTESDWWSYLMAAGFVASFWAYGLLYVRSKTS